MAMSGTQNSRVPTIYKAYFSGLNFRGYNTQKYGYPEFPIEQVPIIGWLQILVVIALSELWRYDTRQKS